MTNRTHGDASGLDTAIYERRESSARSYARSFPTVFTKAIGAKLTDGNGREYIDFLAGCSSLNYGHNDPDMKAALVEHISNDGVTHGLDMHTDAKSAFLSTFERLILEPRGMDHRMLFTGPTGANALSTCRFNPARASASAGSGTARVSSKMSLMAAQISSVLSVTIPSSKLCHRR